MFSPFSFSLILERLELLERFHPKQILSNLLLPYLTRLYVTKFQHWPLFYLRESPVFWKTMGCFNSRGARIFPFSYFAFTVADQKVNAQKVTHFRKILKILENMIKFIWVIQDLEYRVKTYSLSESEHANLSNDSIKFKILSFWVNSVSNIGSDWNLESPVDENPWFEDRRSLKMFAMDLTQVSSFKFSGPAWRVSRISQLLYWFLSTPNTVRSSGWVLAVVLGGRNMSFIFGWSAFTWLGTLSRSNPKRVLGYFFFKKELSLDISHLKISPLTQFFLEQ